MQFVNDDMDDLFRRAAEEYPLKTDSGDWDKVLNKMQADGGSGTSGKNDNRKRYFFLLALIPLFLICTTYIKNDSSTSGEKGNENFVNETSLNKKSKPATANLSQQHLTKKYSIKNTTNNSTHSITIEIKDGEKPLKFSVADATSKTRHKQVPAWNADNSTNQVLKSKDVLPVVTNIEENENKETTSATQEVNHSNTQSTPGIIQNKVNDNSVAVDIKPPSVAENRKSVNDKPEELPATITASKEKKASKTDTKFYLGFLAGPDFSMVKSTKIKGTGYSAGLLAGFNLNKKFAVETGIFWDRKRYESDGKNFKTDKLNWPHVTIHNLWGYCDMYEIPVNLRYNFSSGAKRTFFANTGLSSYLMKTENYDYYYERYGLQQYGSREYKNSSKDWFSVAHISIGMQKKLGAIGDLRVEPYLKLPINGVGIGSMQLRSTGVYLGLIKPIR